MKRKRGKEGNETFEYEARKRGVMYRESNKKG